MPDSSQSRPDAAEFDILAQKYLAGELTEQDAARLQGLLESDSARGRMLLGHVSLDAMLRELGENAELPLPENTVPFPRERRRRWLDLAPWIAIAAVVTLAATIAVQKWVPPSSKGRIAVPLESTTRAVAVLTRAAAAEWGGNVPAPTPGSPLEPGTLHLKAGIAQLEFFNGARVLLQGPAELRLISSMEAYCAGGKLSAEVPPQARGFRIGTPQGTVVDLGTEFGLDVTSGGSAVHVLKGEVELHRTGDPLRPLKQGQALELTTDGAVREVAANAAAFTTRAELQRQVKESQRGRLQRWKNAAGEWNSDPDLLVRFDFEPEDVSDTYLSNTALPAGQPPAVADGAIVGCEWTQGRWPAKRALEFRSVSDRARLEIPGELASATLSAWIRVDGLDRQFNSIFMTAGFPHGATHWQILRDGKVRLGVGGSGDYDSPVVFTPERFGRWTHVAVVYDAGLKEVRHYAEGRLLTKVPLRNQTILRMRLAELGNWSPDAWKGSTEIRHFSGAIDEFALWGRVLSDAEIRAIHVAGS